MSHFTSSGINQSITAGIRWSLEPIKKTPIISRVYVFGKSQKKDFNKHLKPHLYDWQWHELETKDFKNRQIFHYESGPITYLPIFSAEEKSYTPSQLKGSEWGKARDTMGALAPYFSQKRSLELNFINCSKKQILGALLGLGMARYSFKSMHEKKLNIHLRFVGTKITNRELEQIKSEYEAVNLARHLVNLPANNLNPETYSHFLKDYFKDLKVKVYDSTELKKKKMGLILGVGQGAATGPYLVHMSYRGAAKTNKPTAFIGKGITFDSGGLDIKPSSNMRLMKKDMGGSASLVGVAYYLMKTKPKINCDFYLGIAENSISRDSFRPGDVLTSSKGLTVEIHNTDAEGRLVLADSMYFAATQNPK
ncbi:MAG: hypothetical protein KDD58_13835, partial [Bdellovibrionales bacterium]|nr:hypothetical protein [Bdellovibrionales bacterium]